MASNYDISPPRFARVVRDRLPSNMWLYSRLNAMRLYLDGNKRKKVLFRHMLFVRLPSRPNFISIPYTLFARFFTSLARGGRSLCSVQRDGLRPAHIKYGSGRRLRSSVPRYSRDLGLVKLGREASRFSISRHSPASCSPPLALRLAEKIGLTTRAHKDPNQL